MTTITHPALLQTKLTLPPVGKTAVFRPTLLHKLDTGIGRKLILVAATAGFGKTTLVAQWASRHADAACWLALDAGDNDASRFFSYLIAALQTQFPNFGQPLLTTLQSPQPTPLAAILPPLLNEQLPAFTEPITLEEAAGRYPNLQLPTELPPPDDVLLHEEPVWDTAVIFLWRDEADRQQIALSLYQINVAQYAYKGSEMLEMTEVNGNQAFWLIGPHYFRLQDSALQSGAVEEWLFVEGNVLIWWEGSVTYRLEGAKSLEDALRIAESLQTVEE